jgi:hypothetical protein
MRRQPLGPRVGLLLEESAQPRGDGWPEGCGATGGPGRARAALDWFLDTQAVDPDWSPRRPASPATASAPEHPMAPQHHHLTRRKRLTLRVEGCDTGMRLILVVTC